MSCVFIQGVHHRRAVCGAEPRPGEDECDRGSFRTEITTPGPSEGECVCVCVCVCAHTHVFVVTHSSETSTQVNVCISLLTYLCVHHLVSLFT